jgi:hypothetical protein
MKKSYGILVCSLLSYVQIANAAIDVSNMTTEPVDILLHINNWIIEDVIPPFTVKHEQTPTNFNYIYYDANFNKYPNVFCTGKVDMSGTLVIHADSDPVNQASKIICDSN